MAYRVANGMTDYEVHIGFRNDFLIVQACYQGAVLELIPHTVFGSLSNFDLPASLIGSGRFEAEIASTGSIFREELLGSDRGLRYGITRAVTGNLTSTLAKHTAMKEVGWSIHIARYFNVLLEFSIDLSSGAADGLSA